MTLQVEWFDEGREPQNPHLTRATPTGSISTRARRIPAFDVKTGTVIAPDADRRSCFTFLRPYPTPRCGKFMVKCDVCGEMVIVTTAGRRDDPRSVRLPCKVN
jgi:hypothetical protein